jgi:hypothetical protein
MGTARSSSGSALFGARESIGVGRSLEELQARGPSHINAPGDGQFILPVDW